jgi:isopentenyl diphosphate isomerase/L-lactate dehydrogenase-like FMN-dependent dehydrogenase
VCLRFEHRQKPLKDDGQRPGVAKAIDIIRNELGTSMGLCGVNTIAEIDDHVLAV